MKTHLKTRLTRATLSVLILTVLLGYVRNSGAEQSGAQDKRPVITSTRVVVADGGLFGPLYVTIGGQERKIADEAIEAWVIQRGQSVVYSGRDGAGGFENEGQSLRIYDASTGKRRKIMSEYYGVDNVTEARTSRGKTALLVEMADGGLGASYLAVVNPARGEVFFRPWVKIISRRGDTVVVGHYRENDWEKFLENENARIKPYRTAAHNLNTILRRRVIFNKPDR